MADSGIFRRDPTESRAVLAVASALCVLGVGSVQFPVVAGSVVVAVLVAIALAALRWRAVRARIERDLRAHDDVSRHGQGDVSRGRWGGDAGEVPPVPEVSGGGLDEGRCAA